MAHDPFDLDIPRPPPSELRPFPESLPPPPAPRRTGPREPRRGMVLAGVCGACVMGAGLGLWARPAEGERQASLQALVRPQAVARQARQLQIVVDDTPAPIGAPMEVMRAMGTDTLSLEPALPDAGSVAPTRPPAGLVRVLTTPLPVETADLEPAPKPVAQVRKVEPAKVEVKTTAKRAEPAKVEKKKAEPKKAETKKADAPKAAKKKPAKDVRVAEAKTPKTKSEKAKADRRKDEPKLAQTDKAKADKPSRAEKAKLAKAERARKDADTLKLAKAERAKAEKAKAAKAEQLKLAEAKARSAKAAKPKVEKAEAAPVRKPPAPAPAKGAGPLRMVSNSCASSDPAENLVCADPSLGAADRRLARAYRQAEAAGVSAAELRRQQQRWLAARAAAAREAPWAVQDVYQARIAELEDLTRDAGY